MLEIDVPAEHGKTVALRYVCILDLVFYFSNDLLLVLIIDFIHLSCLKAA